MPRGKDQKTISKRIDLHYWKKPHRLRTARRALVFLCFAVAVGWIVFATAGKGDKGQALYNPGHVTGAHATIEHNCAACHTPDPGKPGGFNMAVSDAACIKCHEAPMHAPTQLVRAGDNADNPLALAMWLKENGLSPTEPGAAPSATSGTNGAAGDEGNGGSDGAEGGPQATGAAAQPADAHHGGARLVSAQCAACHVEHRGRDALTAVSDQHCTQCHADLSKAVAAGHQPQVQARVVAFNLQDHPAFGQHLPKDDQGNWVDPTKLKFNHKVHLVDQKLNDCAMCHTTWEPNLTRFRPGHDATKPPFAIDTDRPQAWANANDGRYMQPVSYEQHCQACHPIKVSGVKGEFAHEKIEVVRAQVYAAFQATAMTRYEKPPGAEPAAGGRRGRRGARKDDAGPADEGEWLKGELDKLNKNITALQKSCAKCHDMADQKSDVASLTPVTEREFRAWLDARDAAGGVAPTLWDGQAAEVHLAAAMQRRPGRRPGRTTTEPPPAPEGDVPPDGGGDAPAAPKPKPRKPIKPPELQTTEPTGIPDAPRRWFVASQFDHRSHRDMSCIDCHSKLDNLEKVDAIADEKLKDELTFAATDTRAVLSPGMEWPVYGFASSGEQWTVTTGTKSCVDCHQPDRDGLRFATSACVTCHAYHDHSKERYPDGRPHPRAVAAAPAPMEAPQAPPVEEAPPVETPPEAPAEDPPAEDRPAEAAPEVPAAEEAAPEADPADVGSTPDAEASPEASEPAGTSSDPAPAEDAAALPSDEAPAEETVTEEAPADEAIPAEEEPAPAPPARATRPQIASSAAPVGWVKETPRPSANCSSSARSPHL